MKNYIFIALMMASATAVAGVESFTEQVRISSLSCEKGKAVIDLRSLKNDYSLYLVANSTGAPKYLEMLDQHCRELVKNLVPRLKGQVLDALFLMETSIQKKPVYVPPTNPCRPGITKCDNEGIYVNKEVVYQTLETTIDGFRFVRQTM